MKRGIAMLNKMQEIRLEKITLNIGCGTGGEKLENAKELLHRITGANVVTTHAKVRNPTFKIKKGDEIGAKVTLRGKQADELLRKGFEAIERRISKKSFDRFGNFSFGIREYIDFPGVKYDPKIGIIGFEITASLYKPGKRVSTRRIAKNRVPRKQRVTPQEAMAFVQEKYGVELID